MDEGDPERDSPHGPDHPDHSVMNHDQATKHICISKDHTSPFCPIHLCTRSPSAFPYVLLPIQGAGLGEEEREGEVLLRLRSDTGEVVSGSVLLEEILGSVDVEVELGICSSGGSGVESLSGKWVYGWIAAKEYIT